MSSNTPKRQIVVTGIGMISPIGNGKDAFLASLREGRSGISKVESENQFVAYHGLGGEIKDFDEKEVKKKYFREKEQKKSIKVMCREVQMGAASALLALEDSRLDLDSFDHTRMGIDFGANLMYYPPESLAEACKICVDEQGKFDPNRWGDDGLKAMEPLWMLKYLPNMPACHIGIFTDSRGPNNSITLDEASPGVAMTEALNILERGAADVMIVGGTGTRLHAMKTLQARLWDELAYDENDPSASCKPFDAHRSGQVVAEASGSLILEAEEHAKARGATIYGRLISGGSSCVVKGTDESRTNTAIINAMNSALRRGGLAASDLGHINAHGLGTTKDDAAEASAYRALGTSNPIPTTALKGLFGNAGAGTGFLETAASLLFLKEGLIPPTANCTHPDESLGMDIVTGAPRATENHLFANVNFSAIGQASVTLFEVA